ncbi:MAG TPA: class I SAM-dependent methyltransferase [Roseiflexaceae bacterium]|nr:class I SAM-dependent methyltransferase [Roseiflexaceae bacterium]
MHYTLHSDGQSSHQQIARLVRRMRRTPVLDVGAAQGFLGQLLQQERIQIDAVEPHPIWAEHARAYYRTVYAASLEAAGLPAGRYAVVVCADVLEHTVDPVAALKRLREAATDDATFIISLPNVAHIAARLLLLAGRFPQMERGIFDRTHLHFYTRATAEAMLRDAGLQVLRARPTPVPLEQIWPAGASPALLRALMLAQRVGLLLTPTLFGFQWIFVARPLGRSQ